MGLRNLFSSLRRKGVEETNTPFGRVIGHVVMDGGFSGRAQAEFQSAVVYACLRVLANSASILPIKIYRRGDLTQADQTETPLWRVLNVRPNPYQVPSVLKAQIMMHMMTRGNFYAYINAVGGEIRALQPLAPENMVVELNAFQEPSYVWTNPKNGDKRTYPANKILHVQGLVYDGAVGLGLRDVAARLIKLDLSMADHARAFFDNQSVPGQMILKAPAGQKMKPEDKEALKESIRAGYSGANKFNFMLLEGGLEAQTLAFSAADSQLMEQQKNVAAQICAVMGVPPHLIGLMDKMTYNNIEHQGINFVTYGLLPHLQRIEEALNAAVLGPDSPFFCKFNESALLRGDSKTRAEISNIETQNGVISPNEWRARLGLAPYAGGETFMRQLNMGTAPTGKTPDAGALPAAENT